MAKVYKVSLYITDHNEEYQDKEHMQYHLREHLENLWVGIDHLKIQESEEFEWDDDLKINYTNATVEDFEEYFKDCVDK